MHPILIQVTDSFFIGTYGAMIALGLIAAVALCIWRGRARGYDPDVFYDLAFLAALSGFVGARILYILTEFRGFLADPMPYLLSRTGFVFLGGLIGAAGVCSWYVWRKRLGFWRTGDILLPAVALGHAFGRVGCHFSGCCFGGVCPRPFGLEVPAVLGPGGTLWGNAFAQHLQDNLIPPGATVSLPVWPVQLFESLGLFALTAALVFVGSRPHREGLLIGLYLLGYSVLRFGLEYLRGDEARGVYFGGMLSTSQLLSLGLFVAGVAIVATGHLRALSTLAPAPAAPPPTERRRAVVRKKQDGEAAP